MEPNPIAGDPIMARGSITGYDRKQPVFNLISKVLQDALDKS